ncbi:MAG TPA: DUF5681 domain-containing protein [Rhizomicrobium sp.]|jgi:hypothetical protein
MAGENGLPPISTQFQKGRSGNPGGRPGPDKLLREKFRLALAAAMDSTPEAVAAAETSSAVEAAAQWLALEVAAGNRWAWGRVVPYIRDPKFSSKRAWPIPDWLRRAAALDEANSSGPSVASEFPALGNSQALRQNSAGAPLPRSACTASSPLVKARRSSTRSDT